jgi:hypothetical protein
MAAGATRSALSGSETQVLIAINSPASQESVHPIWGKIEKLDTALAAFKGLVFGALGGGFAGVGVAATNATGTIVLVGTLAGGVGGAAGSTGGRLVLRILQNNQSRIARAFFGVLGGAASALSFWGSGLISGTWSDPSYGNVVLGFLLPSFAVTGLIPLILNPETGAYVAAGLAGMGFGSAAGLGMGSTIGSAFNITQVDGTVIGAGAGAMVGSITSMFCGGCSALSCSG